jgi:DNA recombination protein RmuC
MLITLIVLQVAQLTKKKTENDFNFLKELSDFKWDLHIILQSRFVDIVKENRDNDKNTRESVQSFLKTTEVWLSKSFESLSVWLSEKINNFNRTMVEKLETMTRDIDKMTQKVDIKLENIQKDNTNQLEKIRQTVDEKLQHTLEKRLGESFKIVSDRLEQVHKWLWEMQNLAIGVWDLKKVLSNVKTRWTLGEIQLGNILEQIFSPEQYAKNVKVKPESNEVVEFTIRLPWKELEQYVHIPIDSKFPLERYHMVIEAYEIGELESIKSTNKELENAIMKSAKDIREKYINVPYTTDFAIMFLPIEWLYAEVVRTPWLLEKLQSDKVMIAWPTTLVAMLNSLQMWFRTLAIEKRSSEVREVLWQVKTEFDKFGWVLAKAKKKIREASEEIDELVWARTNQIQRKLKNIQTDSWGLEYIKKSEDQTILQKNQDLNLVI